MQREFNIEMTRFAKKIGLSDETLEKALAIFSEAINQDVLRVSWSAPALAAASLYASCRNTGTPRTLNDVAVATGVKREEITRQYKLLLMKMDLKLPLVDAREYVSRIADEVGLSREIRSEAQNILRKASETRISFGKNPAGLAASALYLASEARKLNKGQREFARAAKVSEVTLRNRYKELKSLV